MSDEPAGCSGVGGCGRVVRAVSPRGDQVKVPDETLLWKEKIQKVELSFDFNLQGIWRCALTPRLMKQLSQILFTM
ncbi:hypothetical protein [Dermatophilus congolensis]|uniref:hypothetical protein n=1 Tax=Dermatophilus congolensis TaxID=1863 RepID=UPI0012B5A197|nr:hypothetical protein [Dermatophilus congolensis]MBO3129182.1 hypothetical protein [Dermatophilus congolensis]MBO3132184.1 hypothetical protein [Dermatophilus congolensis]MBO3133660.1 hypothetical protein [Dermatophilus congolensis]MBO3135893.1 hypothetical protein [Dermatophilus congolensis]MBO3138132.1 hypothetical protein [Dermatophilus congolensis]